MTNEYTIAARGSDGNSTLMTVDTMEKAVRFAQLYSNAPHFIEDASAEHIVILDNRDLVVAEYNIKEVLFDEV